MTFNYITLPAVSVHRPNWPTLSGKAKCVARSDLLSYRMCLRVKNFLGTKSDHDGFPISWASCFCSSDENCISLMGLTKNQVAHGLMAMRWGKREETQTGSPQNAQTAQTLFPEGNYCISPSQWQQNLRPIAQDHFLPRVTIYIHQMHSRETQGNPGKQE